MAGEVQVTTTLRVLSTPPYESRRQFNADMATLEGPTPGWLRVPVAGVQIVLSELANPEIIQLTNLGDAYVTYGLYDVAGDRFQPIGEVWPGESWPWRIARDLGVQYESAGTGSQVGEVQLWVWASSGNVGVLAEAFGSA